MRLYALFLLILILSIDVVAQEKHILSGTVYDSNTGESLMGINLIVKGTDRGTVTNPYGFYSLPLPAGDYVIEVSSIGYQKEEFNLSLFADLRKDFLLLPDTEKLDEVVVTSHTGQTNIRSSQMSVNALSAETIKKIPVVLGEVDIIKSLTLLPGVSTAGEGASGFNVRGGAADQNLILLDEAILYDSSHLFGFFSVFNPDAIKNLTLYKGAVPARYGGRLASVLEIQQKDGNNKKFSMTGGIGLISSRLLLEGPIQKEHSSFLVAGRSSYAHLFLPLFDLDNKAFFYDLNTKVSHQINTKNKIFLSGYFGRDVFKISENFANSYGNATLNLRWNSILSDQLFSNISFIFSDYHYGLDLELVGFTYDSGIRNYNLKYDLTQYLSTNNIFRYGINSIYYHFNPGDIRPFGENSGINPFKLTQKYAWENAAYAELEIELGESFTLQGGIRLSSFHQLGQSELFIYPDDRPVTYDPKFQIYKKTPAVDTLSFNRRQIIKSFFNPEPRLGISWILDDNQSLKAGYNRMVQYIHLISNTSSPTPLDIYTPSGKYIAPQKSDQYTIGYFLNHSKYSLEIESFYKKIKNRLDYIPGADLIANNAIEQVLLNGEARAYGAELMIKKNIGRLQGWISYTLSKSEQRTPPGAPEEKGINEGNWYPTAWDKLHDISLTTQFDLSSKWEIAANFIFQTGRPTTYPAGKYYYDGIMIPVFENRNSSRIPSYHRMDFSVTYTPQKEKRWNSRWVFSIYNVYNRKNAASITFRENKETYQNEAVRLSIFGIIPSITYNFKF